MSFFRVGGRKKVEVDVRLVAATNRDLLAASQEGSFRADLYYRINAGTIEVPSLSDRVEEIRPLAESFLQSVSPQLALDPAVLRALEGYAWPGNVRELRNVMERAALLARDGRVVLEDLPREITDGSVAPPIGEITPQHGVARSTMPPVDWQESQPLSLQEIEKQRILEVLESTHWHRGRAADILGISVRTLYRKIKAYDLDEEPVAIS